MKKTGSFNVSTPNASPGFLLWQVTTLWQRAVKDALEPFGLSHSGFVILASLLWFKEQGSETTQTTIIDHTKLDKMTVSKSVRTLQQKGLVARMEHATDTRAKRILLTEAGESLSKEALKAVEGVDGEFFSALSEAEKEALNGFFVRLRA